MLVIYDCVIHSLISGFVHTCARLPMRPANNPSAALSTSIRPPWSTSPTSPPHWPRRPRRPASRRLYSSSVRCSRPKASSILPISVWHPAASLFLPYSRMEMHKLVISAAPKLAELPLSWCTVESSAEKSTGAPLIISRICLSFFAASSKYSAIKPLMKSGFDSSCERGRHERERESEWFVRDPVRRSGESKATRYALGALSAAQTAQRGYRCLSRKIRAAQT